MASYQPPSEKLPIFNTDVYNDGDEPLTYNTAVKKFLRYPYAQGTENLLDTNVNGKLTVSGTSAEIAKISSTNLRFLTIVLRYLKYWLGYNSPKFFLLKLVTSTYLFSFGK